MDELLTLQGGCLMKFNNHMELIDKLKEGVKLRTTADEEGVYIHINANGNIVDQDGDKVLAYIETDYQREWEIYQEPKLFHKACSAVERIQWAIDNKLDESTKFKVVSPPGKSIEKIVHFDRTVSKWVYSYNYDNDYVITFLFEYNIEEI